MPSAASREDSLRKLLWTFGTDQEFERPAHSPVPPNSIAVTPHNFPRLCHRFGLHCDGQQACEIFDRHKLPAEGCNMYTLSRNLLDSPIDTAHLVREQQKRTFGASGKLPRPRTPVTHRDPFRLAKLPGSSWDAHFTRSSPAGMPAAGMPSSQSAPRLEPLRAQTVLG